MTDLPVPVSSHKCVLECVTMTQNPEWVEGVHQRIAQAIRSVREGRLTAQQLAEETERLGHAISRSQIANYESGRKQSLDVAELLVIAAALDVSPLSLLFPGEPGLRSRDAAEPRRRPSPRKPGSAETWDLSASKSPG